MKMLKFYKYIVVLAFLPLAVSASLSDYYREKGEELPSVQARRPLAEQYGIEVYQGTEAQNLLLEAFLRNNEGTLGAAVAPPLPTDNYDTFLTAPLGTTTSTVYVNALPSVTSSIYTIFDNDGTTPREKLFCEDKATTPNRLMSCRRGISFSPVNGVINENAGTGLSHSKNARIAITDNINFSGKALSILSGLQNTSSTDFIIGTGVSTTINQFFQNTASTSTAARVLFRGGFLGWSDDGVSFYRFVDGGSGLSASSTGAIGITDSKIHVNVSSTGGLEINPQLIANRYLQVKASIGNGISTDITGTKVSTSSPFNWTGIHTFSATTTLATSTIASTTISNLTIGTVPASSLVGGTSTTLHYHQATSSVYSVTANNAAADVTFTHNLGAVPKKMRFTLRAGGYSCGSDACSVISNGVWTNNGSNATTTQTSVTTVFDNNSAGTGIEDHNAIASFNAIAQVILPGTQTSDWVLLSVSATTFTIRRQAFNANVGYLFQYEAEL